MRTLELSGELEQYQRIATGSARDMMQLVNDILALTELQAGKLWDIPKGKGVQVLL